MPCASSGTGTLFRMVSAVTAAEARQLFKALPDYPFFPCRSHGPGTELQEQLRGSTLDTATRVATCDEEGRELSLFLQDFIEHCESRRQGLVGNDSLLDRIIVLSAAWPAM